MNKKIVIAIIAFVTLIMIVMASFLLQPKDSDNLVQNNQTLTPEAYASDGVEGIKRTVSFPHKISDEITWTDVSASGKTVSYRYSVALDDNSFKSQFSNSAITDRTCKRASTKLLLDRGVELRLTYTNSNTGEQQTVLLTGGSCK